jgi:hypothetical protein
MQSITVPSFLSPKPHKSPIYYPPLWPVRSRSLALASYIYKSLLGKAPPYLSSLVAALIAHAPAGISHWSPPKAILPLAAFPSRSLLPMTGTTAKITEAGDSYLPHYLQAPAVRAAHRSLQLYIAQLPHPQTVIYFALHPSISTCTFIFCTFTIPVFKCYIVITFATMAYLLLYLPHPTSSANTV